MTATGWPQRWMSRSARIAVPLLLGALLASCASGPVRRVSVPAAQIQQLTVRADGRWSVDLRIENFSSVPMRFDNLDLALSVGGQDAGHLTAQPAVTIGPESGDVVNAVFTPQVAAKLALADALAASRGIGYELAGTMSATPDEGKQRVFEVEHNNQLSPAPGLPGVMR